MKKNFSVLPFLFAFMLAFSITVFAGDSEEGFKPNPNATEAVFDEWIYQGVKIDPPYDKATPVPKEFINSVGTMAAVSGTINKSTTVYYGPSSTYVSRETLAQGKAVSVIEKEGSYYLIEYSVAGGNVRGYVLTTSVDGNFSSVPVANNNINQFGLNISGSTATIYGGPSTSSYVSIGSVSKREIITVLKNDGSSWYHVEYWTSNGNKRGYIQTSNVSVPWLIYKYNKPITTGTRTNDYGSHSGIDIGVSSGTTVYAITSGTAKFRTAYKEVTLSDGTKKRYAVSYGNFVELTFGSNKAIYGHLSSFMSGYTAPNYPNTDPPSGYDPETTKYLEHGSTTVGQGKDLGGTGNSGNSTGPHLHFEIREGSTVVDPFKYVLFAKMPW